MICKICKTEATIFKSIMFGEQLGCEVCDKELCPDCGAYVRGKTLQEGGGVECSEKCGWWFCF